MCILLQVTRVRWSCGWKSGGWRSWPSGSRCHSQTDSLQGMGWLSVRRAGCTPWAMFPVLWCCSAFPTLHHMASQKCLAQTHCGTQNGAAKLIQQLIFDSGNPLSSRQSPNVLHVHRAVRTVHTVHGTNCNVVGMQMAKASKLAKMISRTHFLLLKPCAGMCDHTTGPVGSLNLYTLPQKPAKICTLMHEGTRGSQWRWKGRLKSKTRVV